MEKEKRNQPENEEEKHDLNRSTAQLIHGGIEDFWEEFIMHKENEKEKKVEDSQKEAIQTLCVLDGQGPCKQAMKPSGTVMD